MKTVKGTGIDLCDMTRMERLIANNAFVARVLTEKEQALMHCHEAQRQVEFLAGRYACKEAYAKAVGTGIGEHVSFQDLEILRDEYGAPVFTKWPQKDIAEVQVSIAHDANMATAIVLVGD